MRGSRQPKGVTEKILQACICEGGHGLVHICSGVAHTFKGIKSNHICGLDIENALNHRWKTSHVVRLACRVSPFTLISYQPTSPIMEENMYARIIYGLQLKIKKLEGSMCPHLKDKNRRLVISIRNDVKCLLQDYESI